MNRLLASAFGFLNLLYALALIAAGGYFAQIFGGPDYTLIGLGLGALAAVLVCGYFALLVDIRDTLRELLNETRRTGVVPPKNYIEPRM
jgi:hypothetical protein